jgi:hypothetical protein
MVSGTWKKPAAMYLLVGGAWKKVASVYILTGGQWRLSLVFSV